MKENLSTSLESAMQLSGALAAMVVDIGSGKILGKVGGGFDLDTAAAGNSDVLKAKLRTIELLNLNQKVEDILITLEQQYHVIRPVVNTSHPVFIYVALDKSRANLALARIKLAQIEQQFHIPTPANSSDQATPVSSTSQTPPATSADQAPFAKLRNSLPRRPRGLNNPRPQFLHTYRKTN